jgi:RNA polymerase sigma-70 factor (ECF subfamily)
VSHAEPTLVYLAHRDALVQYAKAIIGDATRAEDVVQEAYIRFSTASGKVAERGQPIVHPLGYLYGIVRNLALDWVRRASRDATPSSLDSNEIAAVASDTPTAETVLLHRDELRVLAEALAELPERTRLAFNMSRLEGHSLQEVAERLGVSVSRAHQMVRTAMIHGARRLRGVPR